MYLHISVVMGFFMSVSSSSNLSASQCHISLTQSARVPLTGSLNDGPNFDYGVSLYLELFLSFVLPPERETAVIMLLSQADLKNKQTVLLNDMSLWDFPFFFFFDSVAVENQTKLPWNRARGCVRAGIKWIKQYKALLRAIINLHIRWWLFALDVGWKW